MEMHIGIIHELIIRVNELETMKMHIGIIHELIKALMRSKQWINNGYA